MAKEISQQLTDLVIIPSDHEGEIRRINDSAIYLRQGKKLVEMASKARASLLAASRVGNLKKLMAPDIMVEPLEEKLEEISQGMNPSLLEVLKQGRLHLRYVLNCYGGSNKHTETHDAVGKYIRASGGKVSVIGGRNIASNAALLFMSADERLVIPSTEFTLHLGTLEADPDSIYSPVTGEDVDPEEFVEYARQHRLEMIEWFKKGFLSKIPQNYSGYERIVAWVDSIPCDLPEKSAGYQDHPFIMSGEELFEAGLAQMITGNPLDHFMELIKLKGDPTRVLPERLWEYLDSLSQPAHNY